VIKSCFIVEKALVERRIHPFYTRLTIGRSSRNDIILPDSTVSKRHAVVGRVKGKTVVKDMDSHNGTFVNGERIRKAELSSGDHLKVGRVNLRFFQAGESLAGSGAESAPSAQSRKKLGEYLVEAGIIDAETLLGALDKKKENQKIGEMLVDMGLAEEEDIAKALAKQLKMDFIRLDEEEIAEEVSSLIPAEVAQTYQLLPVKIEDGKLVVAMVNPLDSDAIQILRVVARSRIEIGVTTPAEILNSFGRCYPYEYLDEMLDTAPDDDDVVVDLD
jgi:pSer/pThr/pTyr-binding forkhead associated (FHA) protein